MQDVADRLAATDRSGVIARRLLLPYLNHAASMYESRYATRADIDASMRYGCGYPTGPLALIDALGAAGVVAGLEALHEQTGDRLHEPASILCEQADSNGNFDDSDAVSNVDAPAPEFKREIKTIGVVGTGQMALGIVEVFAKAGYDVIFVGRSNDKLASVVAGVTKSLEKAVSRGRLDEDAKAVALGHITGSTQRDALADVDIVVEAIVEDLEVKRALFADLDRLCKPGARLATTTSSLPIAECAAATARSSDVIGMHFFNPAPIMKLVEVVTGDQTAADVDETVRALCLQVGKHPVSCGDRAGFIVNALLFPYLNDAVKALEDGIGTRDEIDEAMLACKVPMGPFHLLDVVGNDVSLAIQQTLFAAFDHSGWEPADSLERVVAKGDLGRKTGKGFHDHTK